MIFFNELYVVLIILSSILFWTAIPQKFRTRFIILTSFIALAFIQIRFSLFLLLLVLVVFYGARFIERSPDTKSKLLLLWILIVVSVLIIFKYGGGLFSTIHYAKTGTLSETYLVPLGISYLSVKLIAFIIDVYRGTIKEPSLEELLALIFFLPIFPAGPIEKYQNFANKRNSEFDWPFYTEGLRRLALGYFKKVVLVNFILNEIIIKKVHPVIASGGISLELPAIVIIAYLFGALLYAYIDLSAYADIAIGFGHLFGYKVAENMNWPIMQKNLGDYWNCWHITLSHWCRDNVFFPVLGKTRNITLGLYCSFIVMGLWHYMSVNWILWGMWHATGITIYQNWNKFKRKNKKIKKLLPKEVAYILGVVLTVLYASLGFSFIMMDNAPKAIRLLLAIFL
jgi:alginate O-acetyltransferase complex protein AlgI